MEEVVTKRKKPTETHNVVMTERQKISLLSLFALIVVLTAQAQSSLQQYEHVDFSKVLITDGFWRTHVDKVTSVTIPVCIHQTEVATPRIRNFEVASGLREGIFGGKYFDDSDVYKALEAIAYSLKNNPDKALEEKADEWIAKIAKTQQPDGYINTYFTLTPSENRWTDMNRHEAYCGGHLIEAGIAYYNATGKRALLDVGIRFADHMDAMFGPGKRNWVPGHQEIELALVKLYKVTKNDKYLKLSDWLLNQRGHGHGTWSNPQQVQDLKPLTELTKVTGHAVRAMYYFTAAVDVAALTGNMDYVKTMKTLWEDVVYRNMYVTGGIGQTRRGEGFTSDYDLPNGSAYCETCASVGMVFWNQRMGKLTGESKYVDILEKSLYNGALAGISLKGDRFFYVNPLSSGNQTERQEWFGTACCPSNIARLISSLGNYIYGYSDNSVWVNLFISSKTTIPLKGKNVKMQIETNYPWDGIVKMTVDAVKKSQEFTLRIRIPGWVRGEASPGGLYHYHEPQTTVCSLSINGKTAPYTEENGYAVVKRTWNPGDVVEWIMPMNVLRVEARDEVKVNHKRIAFQRGPLIYCVEGDDNGLVYNIIVPHDAKITAMNGNVLNEKIVALDIEATSVNRSPDGKGIIELNKLVKAIPYYTWCN